MQDLKDLDKQHRRRRGDSPEMAVPADRNALNDLTEPPMKKRRLRIILPVLALLLASYPIYSLLGGSVAAKPTKPPTPALLTKVDNWGSFRIAAEALPSARMQNGAFCAPVPEGGSVVYAIDQRVQQRIEKVMHDAKVPYAALVALEPKTGKVLAAVSHSTLQPAWEKQGCYGLYPMASLFKIVTAAAALEEKKVSAETSFAFNGKHTSESPKYWRVKPGRRNQQMTLTMAMGKSVNPVFGRLAGEVVGRDPLLSYAEKFGFNQAIFPGTPILPSRAPVPASVDALMRMGAGLDHEVQISPFHAASLIGAVANGGVMMTPSLAQEVRNQQGSAIYTAQPMLLRRVVTPETAASLAQMLSTTVVSGTSRKAFHDRRGRPMFGSLRVAAKTGSINGKDPAGHYSWFAAYAPMEDPQIAIAALVINQNTWRIKASQLGEQALEAYFK